VNLHIRFTINTLVLNDLEESMSIKLKLILSYIAMLFIPIIFSLFALLGLERVYDVKIGDNPVKVMEKTNDVFSGIISVSEQNNDSFLSKSYLAFLEKSLKTIKSGIIVRKNNYIVYTSKGYENDQILKSLPTSHYWNGETRNYLLQNKLFTCEYDCVFRDGSKGSIFFIRDISSVEDSLRKLIFSVVLVLLSILIFTNGMLTYLVSKSIIRPLNSLKKAANEIKEGNLDFCVNIKHEDEIGELAKAFEDMRQRLKESVTLQLQYENNRKELISNISHDLKTPVAAIKGYVEGIMDGVADTPEKMEKYINTINHKASDLDRLIEELFLFSKLDLKKVPFNFEKIDIKAYLEFCIEELEFDLKEKGVKVIHSISYESGNPVLGDREKLKRVIMNIVENAVKYMDKEERMMEISLSENETYAIISIWDNGMGIPEESLPFIFDRFYRTDPARNTLTGGSGLGMSIAKQIIEEHGGNIWVESQEGIGSKFSFTLKKI